MSTQSELKNQELVFTNSNSNTGTVSFDTNDEFSINRATKFTAGLVTSSLTVSSGTGFTVSSKFESGIEIGDVKIDPPSNATAYTVTLPAAQGSANTQLTNDGSGNLTWSSSSLLPKEYARFSINNYGLNGSGSGDGVVTLSAAGTSDHVAFDTVVGYGRKADGATASVAVSASRLESNNQSGSPDSDFDTGNIILNTTTAYTTTVGTACLGRVTLKAGQSYRVSAMVAPQPFYALKHTNPKTVSIFDVTSGTATRIGTTGSIARRLPQVTRRFRSTPTNNISQYSFYPWDSNSYTSSGVTWNANFDRVTLQPYSLYEVTVGARILDVGSAGYIEAVISDSTITYGTIVMESISGGTNYSALPVTTCFVETGASQKQIGLMYYAGTLNRIDPRSFITVKEVSLCGEQRVSAKPAVAFVKAASDVLIEARYENDYTGEKLYGDAYVGEVPRTTLEVEML